MMGDEANKDHSFGLEGREHWFCSDSKLKWRGNELRKRRTRNLSRAAKCWAGETMDKTAL